MAYHIDVQKVGFGWNVLIHKGPDTQAPCIMKLSKKKAIWDKNAQMVITVSCLPSEWLCLVLLSGWVCHDTEEWPSRHTAMLLALEDLTMYLLTSTAVTLLAESGMLRGLPKSR